MSVKTIIFILAVFQSLNVLSKDGNHQFKSSENLTGNKLTINNTDSVIFDLANATLTTVYIDIPVYIKSDDVVFGLDYGMQFNLGKLTFSTTIDLITADDPTLLSSSFFNPGDFYLRYTATTLQNFPLNGEYITKIRFALSAPCVSVSAEDFTNAYAILNGAQCSVRLSSLNFSQFIPVADFNSSPACLNTVIQFSNTSTIANGTIASISWSFGNGSTSALQNPSTTYTATGIFSTTLILVSDLDCRDTLVTPLSVNLPPSATINPAGTTTFCPANPFVLTGTDGMSSYLWSNGATTQSISTSDGGTYSLQVVDLNGCSATSLSSSVLVNTLPEDFTKNGVVDISDFIQFASVFGMSCTCLEDLNSDGIVSIDDFLIFVPYFNVSCQ